MSAFEIVSPDRVTVTMDAYFAEVVADILIKAQDENPAVFAFAKTLKREAEEIKGNK